MKKKFLTGVLAALCCVSVSAVSLPVQAQESGGSTNLVARIRAAEQLKGETAKETFADRIAQISGKYAGSETAAVRPKVAVLYVNNAKSTYDDAVDKEIFKYLNAALPEQIYDLVDGAPFLEKLNQMGYMDLSMAERTDYVEAFAGTDVDYCLYLEIQPFVARDKVTFFTIGKDITTAVPFRIINLGTGRYIYTGKYTEKASDSTVVGGIGNKSVALKAIGHVGEMLMVEIQNRLPKTRAAVEPAQ